MIILTVQEEVLRIAAFNLILKRKKDYDVYGVGIKSILCRLPELRDGTMLRDYTISGIDIAITVPLTKIYFLSHPVFHILKSTRPQLDDFVTFIEKSTLRIT